MVVRECVRVRERWESGLPRGSVEEGRGVYIIVIPYKNNSSLPARPIIPSPPQKYNISTLTVLTSKQSPFYHGFGGVFLATPLNINA